MTVIVISALEKKELKKDVTLTVTIDQYIDTRQYIEANVGINVEYVDNIDDVLEVCHVKPVVIFVKKEK